MNNKPCHICRLGVNEKRHQICRQMTNLAIFVEYSIFSTLQCLLRAHYKHDYSLDAKSWSLTRNLQQGEKAEATVQEDEV